MQKIIITIIITFVITALLISGIGLYFFFKTDNKYKSEIQRRDDIITELETKNTELSNINEQLTSTNIELRKIKSGFYTNNNEAIIIINRLEKLQSEIRSSINAGTEKK